VFAVAQLGARGHYAVPRVLWEAGLLACLYTDLTAVRGWPWLLRRLGAAKWSGLMARMAGRLPAGVPPERVVHWPAFAIEYYWRQRRARSPAALTAAHLWAGREFCLRILRYGLADANAIYAFNSAALELLEHARDLGLFRVVEQTIAPVCVADRLLAEEHSRWPGWEQRPVTDPGRAMFAARERGEWECADLILCGSEFVRQGIAEAGGPVDRCVVLPYGVPGAGVCGTPSRGGRPLQVLVAGAVGLRKGAPYVAEAARRLGRHAQFRWAGEVSILPGAIPRLAGHVELVGPVPRSKMANLYARADVFLLPSIVEGSAIACYEALAAGLPVVTTPHAGSVVRDAIDGFIVPVRDVEAIVERLTRLAGDPALRAWMSANAVARASEFTLAAYSSKLLAILAKFLPGIALRQSGERT
jgi:glycosyltransferase involved in cell wall biosynthesis